MSTPPPSRDDAHDHSHADARDDPGAPARDADPGSGPGPSSDLTPGASPRALPDAVGTGDLGDAGGSAGIAGAAAGAAGAPGAPGGPDGLLAAFAAYERALMADDLAAMDGLFSASPDTLRGDPGGLLVGHDAIHRFRAARAGGAPARDLADVRVVPVDDDHAVVVAVTAPATGGRGLQTQSWRREPAAPHGWVVTSAHVSPPPATFDARVWRVVGDPLVPAGGNAEPDPPGAPGDTHTGGETGDEPRRIGSAEDPDGGTADGGEWTRGDALVGETVAVKDVFAVAGFGVGAGVPARLAEAGPESAHAGALARLLGAGASVRGIARTDQFAYSLAGDNPHYGTPVNPVVPGALPGGSSSGSAVAVALGAASIGLATDTAGSVRVPASYQGLWGLRTTHGAAPTDGLLPLAPSFDTVGLLTRTPELLERAAGALLGGPGRVGLGRLVAPRELPALADGVEGAVEEAVAHLGADRVDLPDLTEAAAAFRDHQAFQAWRAHGAWIDAHPQAVRGAAGERFAAAAAVTADDDARARALLDDWRTRLEELLGDAVLLLPSAASAAPRLWDSPERVDALRAATMRLSCLAGITGRPAVSVPALAVPAGPVGLCLVGPRDADLALVALGGRVHRSITGARPRPVGRRR